MPFRSKYVVSFFVSRSRMYNGPFPLLTKKRFLDAPRLLLWSKYSNLLKLQVMAYLLPTAFGRRYAPILDLVTLCYVRFGSRP